MSPLRSLAAVRAAGLRVPTIAVAVGAAAALGASGAVGTSVAVAAADEPIPADPTALRPVLGGADTAADVLRRAGRAHVHRGYLRELRRHDRDPSGAVAELSTRGLRAATARLRGERRAAARAEAEAEAAAAAAAAQPTGVLASIAQCESGGDPAAIGGGGLYRGMYQFDQATWESVGGVGDPAAASVAEQTKRAEILLARAGTAPWPVCGG